MALDKDNSTGGNAAMLRTEAEQRLAQRGATRAGAPDGVLQRLVHELEVHQIELEMQNEELRGAHVAIEEGRHRYSDLFDFAPVGYVTLTEKGVIKEINLTGSLMLGTERAFLTGRPFLPYLLRDDFKRFMDYMRDAILTGEKTTTELTLAVKGGLLPVQLMGIATGDAGCGADLRMVMTDIAARKKAEEELEKYRQGLEAAIEARTAELKAEMERHAWTGRMLAERDGNFEKIMDSSTDGILIVTEGCLCANARMAQMLGYGHDELSGMRFKDLLPEDNAGAIEGRIRELMDARLASYRCETAFVSKDGTPVPVEFVSSSTVCHGHGAALVVVHDVAMRKSLEEERVKTQKLESLGILAGGIAHDFNNMLTGIIGNVSMAAHLIGPENKAHERLMEADRACRRATDLTQQLLTFSKGGTPVMEPFSVGELLTSSVSFALSGARTRCEFHIPGGPLNVKADIGQINQVINNIVINAEQAMPDGGVIKVGAEELSIGPGSALPLKQGRFVRFFVEDNGQGIAPEDMPRIFDPYFTTKSTGSGLGLASAYSIVKRHGGHISVKSVPGGPTRFDVYLEASDEVVAATGRDADEAIVAGSGRILVMDDDEMIRDVAAIVLKEAGYEVECARDGKEAIELYRQAAASGGSFDLVIMDATIPGGMGGQECIRQLLALYPDVRAVVSSGYSNDSVMAEYERYGFCGTIPKPYNPAAMTRAVRNAIVTPR